LSSFNLFKVTFRSSLFDKNIFQKIYKNG